MTPEQINKINEKSKKRLENKPIKKDLYCKKCQIKYSQTTLTTCVRCGKSLITYSDNLPKCPTCQSTNVSKIGSLERGVSVAALGLMSGKIGKTMKCNNCGYKW